MGVESGIYLKLGSQESFHSKLTIERHMRS